MQPLHFNFSHFHQNEQLSDVLLLIRIDGDVKKRLPGHGIVLANVSKVFRDEIESQQGFGGRPSIHLDVRPDQVAAACALVRFVYTGDLPDPSPSQQQQLVHMLALAHKFGVADCKTACHSVLSQCQQLQPEALGLAFMLLSPAATAAAPGTAAPDDGGFGPLLAHCLNQLQRQLGDLESVLSCPTLLAQLHDLPLPALLALLKDERTAAASENTVLAAVHSWMTAAAQRDVRVDAVQREQLAAAVRVPLLEPCYLSTVLPRMTWLLEILGPRGLAAAAGVARGLCDPHAEPVLSNAHACGNLMAGWLQGPRPVPPSCSRAMHGGPALTMHWSVLLSDIKTAFEAACAGAAARALAHQQQQAAAAAAAAVAAQQAALVSSEAPAGWGLVGFSPLAAPASAAAAMQAVATFAGAAAARVFNKRKRSSTAVESCDEGGRDQQSSSTAGTLALAAKADQQEAAAAGEEQQGEQQHGLREAVPLSQPRPQSVQHAAESHGGGEDDEEQQQHSRKRRRRAAPEPSADTAEAGPTAGTAAAAAPRTRGSQAAARKPPAIETQQLSGRTIQPLSPQAGTAAAVGGFFSQDPAAASAAASPCADGSLGSGAQRLPRQFKLRSPEAHFAGYTWRLVLYFQPRQAAADGSTGAERCDANVQQAGASRGVAPQAVAAAHTVRLPEDAAASGAGTGDSSCSWTARLAVEAWPAVTLAPAGSSTVAFSGSLGVCLAGGSSDAAAAAGRGRARGASQSGPSWRRSRSGAASPAGRGARAPGACKDPTPSPARRLNMTTGGDNPARYMTCPEAAAAAAAGGGESSRQQGGRDCSPAGRKLIAGGPRGQAGLLSIPESDRDSEVPESSEQVSSSSSEEEEEESSSQEEEPAAVQDSDCDDEGFAIVGEFPAGAGAAARAAAASTPGRGGGRRGSCRQQQRKPVRRAGRRPASAAAVTPGAPAGGSNDAEEGEWRVLQLPQGSWLRSRGCDTGFTSFFSITLHQDVWDEAAWQPYLQAGNMLQLRGDIWNVR